MIKLLEQWLAYYEQETGESKKVITLCDTHIAALRVDLRNIGKESRLRSNELVNKSMYKGKPIVADKANCLVCKQEGVDNALNT